MFKDHSNNREARAAHLSVALPSSISPRRMSSKSRSDSAGGRSLQGLGSRRSLDSWQQIKTQVI